MEVIDGDRRRRLLLAIDSACQLFWRQGSRLGPFRTLFWIALTRGHGRSATGDQSFGFLKRATWLLCSCLLSSRHNLNLPKHRISMHDYVPRYSIK